MMTNVGTIYSLYYAPLKQQTPTKELLLDEKGVLNDKHYDKDINRSVLLASLDSYTLAKSIGIDLEYGSLGENLLMDYNPYHLEAGARLKIGSAILELVQHCTLCKGLSAIDKKLPELLKNDRGVFTKVVKSGHICTGDSIYLLD